MLGKYSVFWIALFFSCLCSDAFWLGESALAQPANQLDRIAPISRRLPPEGIEIPNDKRIEFLAKISGLNFRLSKIADDRYKPDAEIFVNAVEYAVFHREFYDKKHFELASAALEQAEMRIKELELGKTPSWTKEKGLVVRGYRSSIDGSAQPYGLEIPDKLPTTRDPPLYVWLHGRGDKTTDLHFIQNRHTKTCEFQPSRSIILHPFGRHCIGFKWAGEIDVLEAIEHVKTQYKVNDQRVQLMGFSMGGAGVWHIAAHYPHLWNGASPGAGFADTARYQGLSENDYPPDYVQTLWGLYDVPNYTMNLFNMPVVAYAGENDKQIQAAQLMLKAYSETHKNLVHPKLELVVGRGMGHEYDEMSRDKIMKEMRGAERTDRTEDRDWIYLQTRTLRYNRAPGVEALALGEHWKDASLFGMKGSDKILKVKTKNITAVRFPVWQARAGATIEIDGQKLSVERVEDAKKSMLFLNDAKWEWKAISDDTSLRKRPGLQGPIDDAFMNSFLVVVPTGDSKNPHVQRWLDFEMSHFEFRWRTLFRGTVRLKKDTQITEDDAQQHNLILWGDAESNSYLKSILSDLPIKWNDRELEVNGRKFDATKHVPALIYPNPKNPSRYIVINSGPTFREAHDESNSLQNAQLPDWAVINLDLLPNAETPGSIVNAGFFDESWQYKKGN